jgi:hypothetical protein
MDYRSQWKQVSLKALELFMESEINNNTEPIMTTTKKNNANSTNANSTR